MPGFFRKFLFLSLLYHSFSAVQVEAVTPPDGGMYPISMLNKLPLKKAGLRISSNDIYNPNGTGLLQAVVQIGGCTGSFVSGEGLIITNHHCAFGSLEPYSSTLNNLLEKGYLAKERKMELPMRGLTCKILESHKDVSDEVLAGTQGIKDMNARNIAIDKNMNRIRQAEELKNGSYHIEVSEMLPGKSYILFRYKVIKDLRIVYVPPRDIGEFGGETDNWVWPRHTGDFAFVRAYVNKEGNSAPYDTANIPYEPKEYLNINSSGLSAGDFVFILGYPGRTYRQKPAAFLKFQQDYQLPLISELYQWQIEAMDKLGDSDLAYKIKTDPLVKSLANVMKNYKGKLQGLKRLDLYQAKQKDDEAIATRIGDPVLRARYEKTLADIDKTYQEAEREYKKYAWYILFLQDNYMIKIAHILDMYREMARKNKSPSPADKQPYVDLLRNYYKNIYIRYDTMYLVKMLSYAAAFNEDNRPLDIGGEYPGNADAIREAIRLSHLPDSSFVFGLIAGKTGRAIRFKDPFISLAHSYYADYSRLDSMQNIFKLKIENLQNTYLDIKMQVLKEQFIPDANRTLRITYGYIKGYSPRDGVYFEPFTTVAGMIEKNGTSPDYTANDSILNIFRKNAEETKASGKNVPLCILYNTDTTGGNSGSPVLNKYGQLVGLNFDRNFEATVNDYAWNDAYSRSIGLDIRFVLWDLARVAGAKNILDEMFIDDSF